MIHFCPLEILFFLGKSVFKIVVAYSNTIKQRKLIMAFSIEEINFRRIMVLYVLEGFTTVNLCISTCKFKVILLSD